MDVVLTLSGGLDSAVLLYQLRNLGYRVRCLSVNYGQRHKKELEYAGGLCHRNRLEHRVVDLSGLRHLFAGSSQTTDSVPVPEGHYEEESMKATVVPNRNMVLLSLATAWAISVKANAVAYAAHGGDHAVYPDCRPEFAEALARVISLADWRQVGLLTPFLRPERLSKADIVREGAALGVPFALTWSCYKGGEKHCGVCGTCRERVEAFQLVDVTDPTEYENVATGEGRRV